MKTNGQINKDKEDDNVVDQINAVNNMVKKLDDLGGHGVASKNLKKLTETLPPFTLPPTRKDVSKVCLWRAVVVNLGWLYPALIDGCCLDSLFGRCRIACILSVRFSPRVEECARRDRCTITSS